MKRLIYVLGLVPLLSGCHPTEQAYRTAYERARAGQDSLTAIENTIYGAVRRGYGTSVVTNGTDSAEQRSMRLQVSDGGGGIREYLRPYSVAVGGFKQRFNAISMRERLADNGYPGAFVVETAEPYYYVIISSWRMPEEALSALTALRSEELPVKIRAPYPFIIRS